MYSVFSAGSADFVCRLFKKKILFLFLINIRKIFLDVPEHFHISPDTGFCHRNRTDTSGIKDLLCLQSGYQGQLTNRHFQPTLFQIAVDPHPRIFSHHTEYISKTYRIFICLIVGQNQNSVFSHPYIYFQCIGSCLHRIRYEFQTVFFRSVRSGMGGYHSLSHYFSQSFSFRFV